MDTLNNCESSVLPGDFQIVFDLENMYFHFRLHESERKFFAFALPDIHGTTEFYQFNVMCYVLFLSRVHSNQSGHIHQSVPTQVKASELACTLTMGESWQQTH